MLRASGTRTVLLAAGFSLLLAAPAFAIYPQLSTNLTGPAIGGRVPEGDAKVDQSRLPNEPAKLDVRIKNVNLPDGTVLDVFLTDCGTAPVGTITLSRGEGQLSTRLSTSCPIGRTSSILLNHGSTMVARGGSPWKV